MIINILGSCSGTEPFPNRFHTSIAIEMSNGLYFFDAGESCSRTAHLIGLDLLTTRRIIISHTHFDHIGGLAGLLWNINKLSRVQFRPACDVEIHIPNMESFKHIMGLLTHTQEGFKHTFTITPRVINDGILFADEYINAYALQNKHIRPGDDGKPLSYSFRINATGKIILYSGDVKCPSELISLFPADLILMETGHHNPIEVAAFFTSKGFTGKLAFMHHGQVILSDPVGQLSAVRRIYSNTVILNDGDKLIAGVDF